MNQTKYGVISDVHNDPRAVRLAVEVLMKEGVEKLLVNGTSAIDSRHFKKVRITLQLYWMQWEKADLNLTFIREAMRLFMHINLLLIFLQTNIQI